MAIHNEVDYDDDNGVTIGKELEIVNSSSRAMISDLALHERIKDKRLSNLWGVPGRDIDL